MQARKVRSSFSYWDLMNLDPISEGQVISGRYEIKRLLGSGGMGAVYLAEDRVLEGNKVALKILHDEMTRDQELTKRFLREVQLMHQVNHKNVVRTYDVGLEGSSIYFTMEFVSGEPLVEILDSISHKGHVSIERIANLTIQICEGLEAIHQSEILHRDLKPQNIMVLPNDVIKITDFGVARPKDSTLTQHNEIIGSAEYMAPEIWTGNALTPSVDLYAFGVILYELATGKLPFESEEPARLMWLHIKQPPTPPKSIRGDIPAWLNQLILGLLQKRAKDRPANAGEVVNFVKANANGFRPGGDVTASQQGTKVFDSSIRRGMGSSSTYPSVRSNSRRKRRTARWKLEGSLPVLMMGTAFLGMVAYMIWAVIKFFTGMVVA